MFNWIKNLFGGKPDVVKESPASTQWPFPTDSKPVAEVKPEAKKPRATKPKTTTTKKAAPKTAPKKPAAIKAEPKKRGRKPKTAV